MKYLQTDEEKLKRLSSSVVMNNLSPILFLIFLVLKLTKQIDWSWWWVTSPIWISLASLVVVGLIVIIVKFVIQIYKQLFKRS